MRSTISNKLTPNKQQQYSSNKPNTSSKWLREFDDIT
jgi:hypothetical protein